MLWYCYTKAAYQKIRKAITINTINFEEKMEVYRALHKKRPDYYFGFKYKQLLKCLNKNLTTVEHQFNNYRMYTIRYSFYKYKL